MALLRVQAQAPLAIRCSSNNSATKQSITALLITACLCVCCATSEHRRTASRWAVGNSRDRDHRQPPGRATRSTSVQVQQRTSSTAAYRSSVPMPHVTRAARHSLLPSSLASLRIASSSCQTLTTCFTSTPGTASNCRATISASAADGTAHPAAHCEA